jgi:hypothetical protein
MDINNNNTDLFRPEFKPGATEDGLSLPQHDDIREAVAEQQHQPIPAPTQATKFP